MNNNFYYLVPKGYDDLENPKNEYFIIRELMTKNFDITPIYNYTEIGGTCNGILFNSLKVILKNKKILTYANKYKIPIFWWYFDNAETKLARKIKVIQVAKKVSIFFNKNKNLFSNYLKSGINPIWLDQGVPKECIFPKTLDCKYDVSFFGSYEKVHSNRSKLLKKIDEQFNLVIYTKDTNKFLKKGFKNVQSFVPMKFISEKIAKINLVLNGDNIAPYCWSNRVHLTIGSGGFSLVENTVGLENYYLNNKHCIYFNDKKELIKHLDYWLLNKNKEKREKISKNGFDHAHKQNSYEMKTNFFITKIQKFIINKHV